MYTEDELLALQMQEKKRIRILIIVSALLLAAIIVSAILRIQLLSVLLTILLGSILVFFIDLKIRPVRQYSLFIDYLLHGPRHELDAVFKSISDQIDLIDGVACREVTVIDDHGKKPAEIMFHFDAKKTFPELDEGMRVHVVYHDRAIIQIIPCVNA